MIDDVIISILIKYSTLRWPSAGSCTERKQIMEILSRDFADLPHSNFKFQLLGNQKINHWWFKSGEDD